jgi:hypothetical protein
MANALRISLWTEFNHLHFIDRSFINSVQVDQIENIMFLFSKALCRLFFIAYFMLVSQRCYSFSFLSTQINKTIWLSVDFNQCQIQRFGSNQMMTGMGREIAT